MKKSGRSLFIIGMLFFLAGALIPVHSFAADVDVYIEGAYTDTDLAVYIYADINGPNILSAGVKLTYETSELTLTSAKKNESVWSLGNESYMDPETSTPGEVIIICGKLDTSENGIHALDGVSGDRVLLGKVIFSRTGNSTPFSPTLTIDYGKRGPGGKYKNFVATDGTELDDTGVAFGSITVAKRGDANADGIVNFQDMLFIRDYTQNGGNDTPFADCNNDGIINFQDMLCVKAMTQ